MTIPSLRLSFSAAVTPGFALGTVLLLQPAASSQAAISLTNGSFENTEGSSLIPPAPDYDILKPVGWNILTVGTAGWDAGSTRTTGAMGNYDAIAAGSVTGPRYLRLASDTANSGFGAVAQNLGTMVIGETYTFTADAFGGNGTLPFTGVMELRSTGANTGGTIYASSTVSGLAQGAFTAGAFSVSYTATALDNGQPLWLRLGVDVPGGVNQAFRGAVDNVQMVPEPSAALLAGGLAGLGLLRRRRGV